MQEQKLQRNLVVFCWILHLQFTFPGLMQKKVVAQNCLDIQKNGRHAFSCGIF